MRRHLALSGMGVPLVLDARIAISRLAALGTLIVALVVGIALVFVGLNATPETGGAAAIVRQLDTAVAFEGIEPAARNGAVTLPTIGSGYASLAVQGGKSMTMGLPGKGQETRVGLTSVFDGAAEGSHVAVQPTTQGLRALISVDNAAAPERYAFPLGGDVAALRNGAGGTVIALDARGRELALLTPAWARDAQGRSVPTHYELEGTTVVQVIEHVGGNYAYGITADPWLWVVRYAWIKCQTNPYCRYLLNSGWFWRAIDWARRFL